MTKQPTRANFISLPATESISRRPTIALSFCFLVVLPGVYSPRVWGWVSLISFLVFQASALQDAWGEDFLMAATATPAPGNSLLFNGADMQLTAHSFQARSLITRGTLLRAFRLGDSALKCSCVPHFSYQSAIIKVRMVQLADRGPQLARDHS